MKKLWAAVAAVSLLGGVSACKKKDEKPAPQIAPMSPALQAFQVGAQNQDVQYVLDLGSEPKEEMKFELQFRPERTDDFELTSFHMALANCESREVMYSIGVIEFKEDGSAARTQDLGREGNRRFVVRANSEHRLQVNLGNFDGCPGSSVRFTVKKTSPDWKMASGPADARMVHCTTQDSKHEVVVDLADSRPENDDYTNVLVGHRERKYGTRYTTYEVERAAVDRSTGSVQIYLDNTEYPHQRLLLTTERHVTGLATFKERGSVQLSTIGCKFYSERRITLE